MDNWFAKTRYASVANPVHEILNTRLLTPPMLMLPWVRTHGGDGDGEGGDNNLDKQVFYSFLDDRYHDLRVPGDLWCVGSSRGWLVLVDCSATFTLLNPMFQHSINIPPATGVQQLTVTYADVAKAGNAAAWDKFSRHRAVMSPAGDNFLLAVILGEESLALYSSFDRTWTDVCLPAGPCVDAVFHGRELYTVSRAGYIHNHATGQSWPSMSTPEDSKYLVELGGYVLLVVREYEEDVRPGPEVNRRRTKLFRVYYKEASTRRNGYWREVRDLNGYMIFVGRGTSFSLLASHSGRSDGDLIYFLNRENDGGPVPALWSDCGVFCLREGRMRPPSNWARPLPTPDVWLRAPALWVAPFAVHGTDVFGSYPELKKYK